MPSRKAAPAAGAKGAREGSPTDFVEEAKSRIPELARQAERVFQDRAGKLRAQSKEAAQAANEQLETARTYVVERVQERPFTTTIAVLGAGFLLGLLFAGRRR
jgi:ElaB/YqjD/DUF883 family membrane-anchored ribosome-binding protein